MHTSVSAHVDVLDRGTHRSHHPIQQPAPKRGHRDHDAVVVRIVIDIEDMGSSGR
jgi:hypothetical protein